MDKYLEQLDKYLNDDRIRREVRLQLIERLSKYSRFQNWGKRPNLAQARSVDPTIAEVKTRSETLANHIDEIIASRGNAPEVAKMRQMSEKIVKDSQQVFVRALAIEEDELVLLTETGNLLFRD